MAVTYAPRLPSVCTRSPRKLPSASEAELGSGDVIAAVVVAEERFGALVDPLHRPAEAPCRPQDENGLGIQEVLHAEAAAYVRRDDADILRGHLERVREDAAGEVDVLARGVEQIASLALVVGAQRSARARSNWRSPGD